MCPDSALLDSIITDGLRDCLLLLPTNFLFVNYYIIYESEKFQRSLLSDYCLLMNLHQRKLLVELHQFVIKNWFLFQSLNLLTGYLCQLLWAIYLQRPCLMDCINFIHRKQGMVSVMALKNDRVLVIRNVFCK